MWVRLSFLVACDDLYETSTYLEKGCAVISPRLASADVAVAIAAATVLGVTVGGGLAPTRRSDDGRGRARGQRQVDTTQHLVVIVIEAEVAKPDPMIRWRPGGVPMVSVKRLELWAVGRGFRS